MSSNPQPVILNVDDNEAGRYAVTKTLKNAGFGVIEAPCGLDALRFAPNADLIVLDIKLPDIDGFEVCRRLKSDPTTSRIPVLYLSAVYRDVESTEQGLDSGAEAYLTHPVDPKVLVAYTKALLRSHFLENELIKVNRALKAITECDKAMLMVRDEAQLTSEICKILVQVGGHHMAWVGYAEHDKEKTVRPVAHFGHEDGYLDTVRITWSESEIDCEPTGTAILTGKPCQHKIVSTDPNLKSWRAEAAKRGYVSSWAVPLMSEGKPFGALNIYASVPDAFPEETTEFLGQFANDLSYGIENLRVREKGTKSEDALHDSEMLMRGIFDSIQESVIITTPDRVIKTVNPATLRIFGYEKNDLVGHSAEILHLDHERYVEFGKRIKKSFDMGESAAFQFECKRANGSVFPTEHMVSPLKDRNGASIGIVSVVRDITERKTMEERLIQSQKMEAVGTLAGGIAHDFNNLLQPILGYSEVMLLRKKEGEPDFDELQKIYKAGQRGADMIKNLMTFSRKVATKHVDVDLNQEVTTVRNLLFHTIPKTIDIDLHLKANLQPINADPSQISQVLMNLGVNARDAMPDGGTLTIETTSIELDEVYCSGHPETKPGRYVLLTVSDTGQGMEKETLSHIFEPFFTTKEKGKGTGLGLATVYGIVKQNSGHITCYSEPGHGTTFKIYFPATEKERESKTPTIESPIPGGTETILLVEDEETIRTLCGTLLKRFGYKVITAVNGKEALEIYRIERDSIALILLDLIMPVMDGRQCLHEILLINSKAKVLIASGFPDSEQANGVMACGAKGFVQKPYQMRHLLTTIREALDTD